jgi:hypothetical protein
MPAFFNLAQLLLQTVSISSGIDEWALKKFPLVPQYHYLPYGYTCYTFPNVKYVADLCVICILAIGYNLL